MSASIHSIAYYLPDRVLTNEQLNNEFPEWSVDKISSKTGIYKRHIANKNEYSSDLAFNACHKLINENKLDKSKINFILLCTQSPDYFLPTTACILQEKLGLETSCGALDYNLGCSGYIYGLALAKGLIVSNIATNILLITTETYSKFINRKDKSNRTIFGDAAAATLITNGSSGIIQEFCLGTDGKGADNLIVKNGGIRNRLLHDVDIYQDNQFLKNDDNLYMNGSEIFSFTSKAVPLLIYETLDKNILNIEDIDLFVFHQANRYMLDFIRKKLNIPIEKFYIFLENCGNTVSSTIPIALFNALQEKRIKKGDKVLLAGFGVGYSWGATIIQY